LPSAWLPVDQSWQVVWLVSAAVLLTVLRGFLSNKKQVLLVSSLLLAVLLLGATSSTLLQTRSVELRTFENSSALVILTEGQAVVVDADAEGVTQANNLAEKQVLYSFGEDDAQAAAVILQQTKPEAALIREDTAREIVSYLPEGIKLLNSADPTLLSEEFRLSIHEGYRLIEIDGLCVLKLLDGYVIINNTAELPAAAIIVDGDGMIHQTAKPDGEPTRVLRFRTD